MSEMLKPGIMLFIITVIAAFLLGGVYEITKEPIRQAELNTKNTAMRKLLPEASDFPNEMADYTPGASDLVQEILTAKNANGEIIGYIISVNPKGYAGEIGLLVAVTTDGSVAGASIVKSNETAGLGANASQPKFIGQFTGKTGPFTVTKSAASKETDIQAITSATITSRAVTEGVNAAQVFYQANLAGLYKGGN